MNLNDTSFLSLKIQQSPAPKEPMTKSLPQQQQQHQQSPAPQSFGQSPAVQQKPPQQPLQQQQTPNKPQPVAQPQKSLPTASAVTNQIPQNISLIGSPAPTFPKLTNKGLAATSTPGQFSFNTSSPTPATNTNTSTTGFGIKPSASEPTVQQPAAQKSLFANLPAQTKPATEQTNPAFGSLASKPTEKAAPSSFAFNLGGGGGGGNKTNEAPKQSLFGAASKPFSESKIEEKKPEETKPADKKTTEPTKPAAVSSLSFGAATGNEKPSLFGSASASSGFSFGAGLGSAAASATPVKPSFSFSTASSTPKAEAKPVAAEAKIEPTPVAETKKSEQPPAVEAKKPEETKKPSLLFGQTTATTGASLFGNKTSTTSLFGVRLDKIVY